MKGVEESRNEINLSMFEIPMEDYTDFAGQTAK
jgi:hypothetical protein